MAEMVNLAFGFTETLRWPWAMCAWRKEAGVPGTKTVVDKVFVYRKVGNVDLKLMVHMSALRNDPGNSLRSDRRWS